MNGFLLSLVAPALWGVVAYLDKYLLDKFHRSETGVIVFFSSLLGALVTIAIYILNPGVLNIGTASAAIIASAGVLYTISILAYLYALDHEDATVVVPLFQIIPIFAFILGYVFLNEVLSPRQMLGALIVLAGSLTLSMELYSTRPKIKTPIVILMLAATLFAAVSDLLFKISAVNIDFWSSVFWITVGEIILGSFLLIVVKDYRGAFFWVLKKKRGEIIAVAAAAEAFTITGNLVFRYALLLAPLAIVTTMASTQPFFVFTYGILLTLFLPKLFREKISYKHLLHRVVGIIVIFIGTFVLNS